MEIKDIVVDVECMEAVRGGQTANVAQYIGGRAQVNLGLYTMGHSVGGKQQLGQYNEDHSVNSNTATVAQNYESHSLFKADSSIFKTGFGFW